MLEYLSIRPYFFGSNNRFGADNQQGRLQAIAEPSETIRQNPLLGDKIESELYGDIKTMQQTSIALTLCKW